MSAQPNRAATELVEVQSNAAYSRSLISQQLLHRGIPIVNGITRLQEGLCPATCHNLQQRNKNEAFVKILLSEDESFIIHVVTESGSSIRTSITDNEFR